MVYAQFYQLSTGCVPGTIPPRFDAAHRAPIEATGDRSVVVIDGRLSVDNMAQIAARECAKRGYVGWRIFKGSSFTNGPPVNAYQPIDDGITVTIGAARLGAKYVGTVSLGGAVIAMTVRFWPSWRAARDDAARLSV